MLRFPNVLKPLANLAPRDSTRYALNGIEIDYGNGRCFGDGDTAATVTDGRLLLSVCLKADGESEPDTAVIDAQQIKKLCSRKANPVCLVFSEDDDDKPTLTSNGLTAEADVVEGVFPNWPEVIPGGVDGWPTSSDCNKPGKLTVTLNAEMLAKLLKSIKEVLDVAGRDSEKSSRMAVRLTVERGEKDTLGRCQPRPVRIDGELENGGRLVGVLMPINDG